MATTAEAHKRAREYETIYVLRQDVDPDGADKVAGRVAEVVARENGKLVKVETWGRRKLAYTVAKQRRGVYYYLKYLGGGAVVSELERNLRMLDTVVKFQTVLLRDDVEVESVAVDPEEVKFTRIELMPEEEKEESRERMLGLIETPEERPRAAPEGDFGDEVPEELDEDWVTAKSEVAKAEAAKAAEAAKGDTAKAAEAAKGDTAKGETAKEEPAKPVVEEEKKS
jgi:small subunit ribosomal protein S6